MYTQLSLIKDNDREKQKSLGNIHFRYDDDKWPVGIVGQFANADVGQIVININVSSRNGVRECVEFQADGIS